jgi:hypothetical protein
LVVLNELEQDYWLKLQVIQQILVYQANFYSKLIGVLNQANLGPQKFLIHLANSYQS